MVNRIILIEPRIKRIMQKFKVSFIVKTYDDGYSKGDIKELIAGLLDLETEDGMPGSPDLESYSYLKVKEL